MKTFALNDVTTFDALKRRGRGGDKVVFVARPMIHAYSSAGAYLGSWEPKNEGEAWGPLDVATFVNWLNQREGLQ